MYDRGAGVLVVADPRRLEQVFLNLLSNAVKFTPAGGTRARSSVAPSADRSRCASSTPAPASTPPFCRTCSSASARPTARRRGASAGSASASSSRGSSSRRRTERFASKAKARDAARRSSSRCRRPRPRRPAPPAPAIPSARAGGGRRGDAGLDRHPRAARRR